MEVGFGFGPFLLGDSWGATMIPRVTYCRESFTPEIRYGKWQRGWRVIPLDLRGRGGGGGEEEVEVGVRKDGCF